MTDYQRAKKNLPPGYYVLPFNEPIRDTDLVFDITRNKFFPADSDIWLFPTSSIDREEIVCVIRKAQLENFQPVKTKVFTIKREVKQEVQGSLF